MKRFVTGSLIAMVLLLAPAPSPRAERVPDEFLRRLDAPLVRKGAIHLNLEPAFSSRIYIPPPSGGTPSSEDDGEAPADLDRVIMMNSDKLTGTLESITDGVISIRSPYIAEAIKIPLQNATRIYFRKPLSKLSPGQDQVLLREGGVLSGKLISMDKEKIVLETEYASALNIRKNFVEAVILASEHRLVMTDDFSEMDDRWQSHSGTWKVKDGKLVQEQHRSYHYISRPVEQEGEMTFEWEMACAKGDSSLGGGLTFFASAASGPWGGSAYSIHMSSSNAYLYRDQNNSPNSVSQYRFPQRPTKVKFKVYYNPEKGEIKVWANSKNPVMTYKDGNPWKTGSRVILWTQRPTYFDNLSITRGSGLPGDMKKGSEESDLIHFHNRDRASGRVEAITGDTVTVQANYGKLELDRKKVFAIVFNQKNIVKPEENSRAAKVNLHNFDKLTSEIKSLDDKVLTATSPYTGEIKVNRSAIKEVILGGQK